MVVVQRWWIFYPRHLRRWLHQADELRVREEYAYERNIKL